MLDDLSRRLLALAQELRAFRRWRTRTFVDEEGRVCYRLAPDPVHLAEIACLLDDEELDGSDRSWWRRALGALDAAWRAAWNENTEFG